MSLSKILKGQRMNGKLKNSYRIMIFGWEIIIRPKPLSRAIPDIDSYSSWVNADGSKWVTPETRK